jgi:hypothetical protein
MGPAAIQMLGSSGRRRGVRSARPDESVPADSWLVDTCHIWARDGIGFEKEGLGWSPGSDRYPAPSVIELRRRR